MTSFIPPENVAFNKRLTGIEQHEDGVVLTFSDAESVEASVVVGADGIKSIVREHVLQDEPSQVAPVYADSYCYRGVIPIETAEDILGDLADTAKFYFGDKRSCVTYRISQGRVELPMTTLRMQSVVISLMTPLLPFRNSTFCFA